MFIINKKYILILGSFITGFSLMTVEITASRIVAPIIGNSIFTWTAIIGIVMLGLAIGSFIGGRIADRYPNKPILPLVFIISAISIFFINILAKNIFWLEKLHSITINSLLLSSYLFLIPSLLIGTIQPLILKKYANNFQKIGSEYGLLSMIWTFGSIFGVFLTGFVFISYLGSSQIIYLISIILLLISLLFSILEKNKDLIYGSILITISLLIYFFLNTVENTVNKNIIYEKETSYYKAQVIDFTYPFIGEVRGLFLDFDSHNIESKNLIKNSYTEIYPIFGIFNKNIINILSIGGGAYTIPKHLSRFYPKSKVEVIEIDSEVVKIAEEYFQLDTNKISTKIGDARQLMNQNKIYKYDLIYGDAYSSFISVPGHLLTTEWNNLIKGNLNEGGIYTINIISSLTGENSQLFNSVLNTFRQSFDNYHIMAFNKNPEVIQNINIIGINDDVYRDETELKKEIERSKNSFLADWLVENPEQYLDKKAIILTDNFYPTEKLMRPIIKNYFSSHLSFLKEIVLNKYVY
jgi:spermidine synthase